MKRLLSLSVILAMFLSISGHAETNFQRKHPRREQVNQRERNQQKRIAGGIESGKMSPGEVSKVEGQEAAIKKQERADVKANGGYLTKGEQKQLNKEENGVSKEIYQDKHN